MNRRSGIVALLLVFILALTLAVFAAALAFILTAETREVGFRSKELQASYLAEAGINKFIVGVQASLEAVYAQEKDPVVALDWLEALVDQEDFTGELETGTFSVRVTSIETAATLQRKLYIQGEGLAKSVRKTLTLQMLFGFNPSQVFDYGYFINNYGWLYGGAQYFAGDVRANGNFVVQGSQQIDGDVYASGTVDESQGSLFYNSINDYYTQASNRARPGDPAAPGGEAVIGGYDGFADLQDASGNARDPAQPQVHQNEKSAAMPYLGDLDYYQELAVSRNGTIKQGGVVVVNHTLTGNLVIIGTQTNPIEIDGPVVVSNDVILKGVVAGQGTIYAGRNIHIIGDLIYYDPPLWPKPDYNPTQTVDSNLEKDLLALCAKGNVIFGDYTASSWKQVKDYLAPPFTAPYVVDAADADIGYVSYYQDGKPYFNGNYLDYDGGKKTDDTSRRYYESSLKDTDWKNLSPTNSISQVNALIYDNHATAGRLNNVTVNGSIIARDEALLFSGWMQVNYDNRVKQVGPEYINIELPITVMPPVRQRWSD